jgi:hypothetical protein
MTNPGGEISRLVRCLLSGDLTACCGLIDLLEREQDPRSWAVYEALHDMRRRSRRHLDFAGVVDDEGRYALMRDHDRYEAWAAFAAAVLRDFWLEAGEKTSFEHVRDLIADIDPQKQAARWAAADNGGHNPPEFDSLYELHAYDHAVPAAEEMALQEDPFVDPPAHLPQHGGGVYGRPSLEQSLADRIIAATYADDPEEKE